jgi:hypothetical protein
MFGLQNVAISFKIIVKQWVLYGARAVDIVESRHGHGGYRGFFVA